MSRVASTKPTPAQGAGGSRMLLRPAGGPGTERTPPVLGPAAADQTTAETKENL